MKRQFITLPLLACCVLSADVHRNWAQTNPSRWHEELEAFERQDNQRPPEPGGIVFVGSSSIRMWDTDRFLSGHDIVNRGFGGSQMSDALQYIDRLVLVHRPRLVVLYEGDNDIAAGEAPAQIANEFQEFARRLQQALPDTHLVYLSIKPSLSRWEQYPQMQQVNATIATYCRQQDHCHFVDVSQVMLNEQGKPRAELLEADGLHLNETGYRLWSDLVRPLLKERH
jgi:lysophospholipase L1-like esterase